MTALAIDRLNTRALTHAFSMACYWALRLVGWSTVTLSCVVAFNVLFIALLGNLTVEGMLLQIDNFGDRFVAASADRRSSFYQLFIIVNACLFMLFGFFRRHSLTNRPNHLEEN
jgi:hypothetical protein